MTGPDEQPAAVRGYVVLHEIEPGLWRLVGDVDNRPGRSARAERGQAVQDATGGTAREGEVYAAVQRDQWHLVRRG